MESVPRNCQFNIANWPRAGSPILNPVSRELSRSKKLQQRAEQYLPGGVNSPVAPFAPSGEIRLSWNEPKEPTCGTPMATATWTTSAPGDR